MKLIKHYPKKLTSWTAAVGISLTLLAGGKVTAATKSKTNSKHKETHHKAGHEAHVHGSAKLVIALDNETSGSILLESPGEGIFGFEHEATSEADKKVQQAALDQLGKEVSKLFSFDPSLECTVAKTKVEVLKEEHNETETEKDHKEEEKEGEHNEVEAEYSLNCKKSIKDQPLYIGLGEVFPKIKKLEVQILKDKKQSSHKLKNAKGKVVL